jgi:FkbM family methyltransferase
MITTTLTLVDGVRIAVPDSLNLITPYILMEQHDWFEDEIKFLRRLLQPGQKIIDIGANYGVYTLSMAKTVGAVGRVWAFEPTSSTAKLLAEGIAINGFNHVVLEQSALSNTSGTAQLSLNNNSELNMLVHGKPPESTSETVPLVTLDDCMKRYDWSDIAFVKIDAEGEEANILRGGKRFFAELSPLVQYEIKAVRDLHFDLVQDFSDLGYDSYRLVPGLDLLVPFDPQSPADKYLLNVFCCKPERANLLAAQGFLLESATCQPTERAERIKVILKDIKDHNAYNWRQTIAKLPYGVQLADIWEQTMSEGESAEVDEALFLYAICRDSSFSPGERFDALEASFCILTALCEHQASYLRLSSLARVALDYGARKLAVNALKHLSNVILQQKIPVNLGEPFLAPGERFDSVPVGKAVGNWILAAVLEELERFEYYSSFYAGVSARQRLEIIHGLGFGSAEMQRRLSLLQKRFGLATDGAL